MPFKTIYLALFLIFTTALNALPGYFEPWGKDADLTVPAPPIQATPKDSSLAAKVAEIVIRFHQNVISPVDGPRSHFRPSSSSYMMQAIQQHGFIKGYIMGCDRLLRENEEEWVYRTTLSEGKIFKWDPPPM